MMRSCRSSIKINGFILLPVVLTLAILAAVAYLLGREGAMNAGNVNREHEKDSALYLAQAGYEHAVWQLNRQNCSGYSNVNDTNLGNHSYSATVTDNSGTALTAGSPAVISATGTLANGSSYTLNRSGVKIFQFPTQQLIIQPDAAEGKDTYLYEWQSARNFGTTASLWVRNNWANSLAYSLFSFDVSAIPAEATIVGAQLELWESTPSSLGGTIGVQRLLSDWDEGTKNGNNGEANWNNRQTGQAWTAPGGDFSSSADAMTIIPAGTIGWYQWDITDLVSDWFSGTQPNYGFAITPESTGAYVEFNASDSSDPSLRPKLTITYACECGITCSTGPIAHWKLNETSGTTAVDSAGGHDGTLTNGPSWDTGVIGGGLLFDGIDDYVVVPHDDNLYLTGGMTFTAWGKTVDTSSGYQAIIAKDTPGNGQSNYWFGIFNDELVFGFWADGSFRTVMTPSSNLQSGSSYHLAASFDNATDTVRLYVDGTEVHTGTISYEPTTELADLWIGNSVDGEYWNGLLDDVRIYDQVLDASTIADLAAEGCASLKPLLMVVGNPASPTSEESARKTLIESWCYNVTLIDDSDSQANYDAAAAVNDVAYIPEEADHSQLFEKLKTVSIGVVNEDGMLYARLGFSNAIGSQLGMTDISVTNNTHYITTGLSLGNLQITTSGQQMHYLQGTRSPDLLGLADHPSVANEILAVLNSGDALHDAGIAVGRRVWLPWGGDPFQFNALNTDGQNLMKRAIEWAGGAGCGTLKPLLLVVSNAVSPSTQESARKTLIESWCYNVTLIDDDASLSDFAAAMALNDVAYISQEITNLTNVTKLKDSTAGVVNEEYQLSDDLGFSAGTGSGFYNDMNLLDNSHYITLGFSLGALALFDPAYDIYTGGGFTLAPDLQVLGEAGSLSVLVTLETGGALWNGGAAAGRRVQVAWGDDFSALNADGKTLMQRAIEWAASAGGDSGPTAHWKLDDGTGSTAVDSVGGHDGTLVSNPAWVAGQLGDALNFDGVDDYVDVGTFDVSGSGLTMMGWFKADTIPTTDPRIISKANGTNEADAWWQLSASSPGSDRYLRMRIKAGGTTTTFADSSVNLTSGQWYFAVGTYENASGDMKLYLDGVEVASGSHAVGGPVDTGPTVPVAIGANGTTERFFDGILDDVRVYDRALTATEIVDLYTSGGGGGGPSGVSFDVFTHAQLGSNGTSLSLDNPNGTSPGDLLIAAVATDGDNAASLSPPTGWNVVNVSAQGGRVTFGVWWKLATASESSTYTFTWSSNEHAYGWLMRFSGHDPVNPIDTSTNNGGTSSSPLSPSVTTTVNNALILRMGGFDDDDITAGAPGLSSHTAINMGASGNGNSTASGGSGYVLQSTAGASGTASFTLTNSEEYVAVTLAIAPAP